MTAEQPEFTPTDIEQAVTHANEVLEDFAARHDMDPALADILQSGGPHDFQIEGRPYLEVDIPNSRVTLLNAIDQMLPVVTAPKPRQAIQGTRTERRSAAQVARTIGWDHPQNPLTRRFLPQFQEQESAGLGRSPFVDAMASLMEMEYGGFGRLDELRLIDPDLERLLSAIANRDPSMGRDTSQATLDARFESVLGIAQLGMITNFLEDVHGMAQLGRAGWEQSRALLRRHLPALFRDDFAGKAAMMRDVGATFSRLVTTTPHEITRTMIRTLANRATNVGIGADALLETLRGYYVRLDRQLPELLAPPELPEVEPEVVVAVGSAATPGAIIVETVVAPDPEVTAEYEAYASGLTERVTAFSSQWSLAGKARKPHQPMTRALQDGFVNAARQRFNPWANADQVVSALARLDAFARSKDGARAGANRLTRDLEAERILQEETLALRDWATSQGLQTLSRIPLAPQVHVIIGQIDNNWAQLREAIRIHWPNNEGPHVATRIEQLLGEWKNPTPAPAEN